ncbi:hypothetical protein [Streptomyces sp. H27-C3]|uniref:dTMP kinase n=1 Tax=Streptomyces sp. H27-C3 TaxID=3046305 RepID=UPI0024BB9E09|nr:hypothetical protein [Streptomyces sp. H27-C3]MDJ0460411.1 hypothetical protein [Streptomyces sp. H27-C3]
MAPGRPRRRRHRLAGRPSRSDLGAFTRSHADQITGRSLACLVAADRYDHLAREIEPQLDRGVTVVCDRYLASKLDGVDEDFLLALNAGVRLPDLSVILTADPAVITARQPRPGERPTGSVRGEGLLVPLAFVCARSA